MRKTGSTLAVEAFEKKIQVVGKATSKKPELEKIGNKGADNYNSLVSFLDMPKDLAG